MPSQTPSADMLLGPAQLPQAASSVEAGAAGAGHGSRQVAVESAGDDPPSPHGLGDPLQDEEVEEEEEEEEPSEDVPMDEGSPASPAEASPSPSDTPAQPKSVSSAAAGLLSLEEAVEQVKAGVLPAQHTGPQGVQNVAPTRRVSPPKMASSAHCFIVGVPASVRAYREGKYIQDGYGGVEALMLFEGLSEQDLQDLATLFAQDGLEDRSIQELVLRPHPAGPPPLVTLEAELGSLLVRREMASLLRQFPPKRLAERVFYTVACLRRLLVRYREMNAQVQQLGDGAVDKTVQLLDANTQLRHDVQFLNDFGEQEVNRVQREAEQARADLEADFRRLADDHLAEEQVLVRRVEGLEVELAQAHHKIRDLEAHAQDSTFDADKLMAFLNDGSTELRGNWPRLRQLFKHFEEGSKPPSSWKTWLQTEAVDEPYRVYSPYTAPPPKKDDDRDDGQGSDEEGKSEDNPPPESPSKPSRRRSTSRSSLRTPPKKSSPHKSDRGSSSKKLARPANQGLQLRPTDHKRGQVGCRSAIRPLERTVDEACKVLPEFVAWQDLRFDVQVALRTGLGYSGVLQLLSEDRVVHDLFPLRDLLSMLASMMYWNKLDDTPWAKFVPNSYFLQAEAVLDGMARQDTIPFKWPPLEDSTVELLSPSSDEHDDPEDQDYDDAAERAAAKVVQDPQGDVVMLDVESDEDNVIVQPRYLSRTKRVRSSSDSSGEDEVTTASKTPSLPVNVGQSRRVPPAKKRKSRAAKASGLRTQSPLARVDFENLTTAELSVVERPGPGIRSWRIHGVRAQYSPKKGKHVSQTPGFPDYAPHKQDTYILAERWDVKEYKALLAKKPWKAMWRNRVKVLFFHRRSDLTDSQLRLLDKFLEYVQDHIQAFWEVLHWLIMKTKALENDDEDDLDYSESLDLYQERTQRHESVGRKIDARIQSLIAKGLPPSIFQEPGVWTYPAMVCYWFLKDSAVVKANGEPFTLKEQLAEIEQAEPGRVQWAYSTDEQRIAHVPDDLKAKLVPARERDLVSEQFQ